MIDDSSASRRYLRHVLDRTGASPGRLAKLAGVSPSTLTRFLNSDDHTYNLSMTTIEKIARATGISPSAFFSDNSINRALDDIEYARSLTGPFIYQTAGTSIIGEVQPGAWKELNFLDDSLLQQPLDISSPKWSEQDVFACWVRGSSISPLAEDGDYLICIRAESYLSRLQYQNNCLLIVEKYNAEGTMRELTARRFERNKGKTELRYVARSPNLSEVIPFDAIGCLPYRVEILGVVHWIIREPFP